MRDLRMSKIPTSDLISLAMELIERPSVSPNDAGCQPLLMARLRRLGFSIELFNFADTQNFWAYHGENAKPTLIFAGHTDVVPVGNRAEWLCDPFVPRIDEKGNLSGRGACDMKSSIAAMLSATEDFLHQYPDHQGRIGFLITSDEEATGKNGTKRVINILHKRHEKIDYCIIGEPSSEQRLGDCIKIGRRGSLIGSMIIRGKQGHIAYPHLACNPIHLSLPWLTELIQTKWDNGNDHFPATSLQIVNIQSGLNAENVIPGDLKLQFGFRFSNELTATIIKKRFTNIVQKYAIPYHIQWRLSGNPFFTAPGELTAMARQAIYNVMGYFPTLSTSGGTSDGRFITKMGCQIIELGLVNASMHQANEFTVATDIIHLKNIYLHILIGLLHKTPD